MMLFSMLSLSWIFVGFNRGLLVVVPSLLGEQWLCCSIFCYLFLGWAMAVIFYFCYLFLGCSISCYLFLGFLGF